MVGGLVACKRSRILRVASVGKVPGSVTVVGSSSRKKKFCTGEIERVSCAEQSMAL